MADVKIRIIGEDKASQVLAGVDKNLGGLKAGLGEITSTATAVTGALAIVGVTIKKAFDLGEEGAAVLQTAQSFDILLEKVGAAPNLLNQLRDASRGTIPDMQLMSSTAALLAGTQGALATSLADATPRLMEIAKAANKLNPSLGDTTFMYQSLALGIKRASPLILDNLGLTIKIGEANQKMADSLGKTVEALTAEEQKQALLNATLEAGDVLINQVGGSVDSQVDAFQRLDTATKNLTDTLKAKLAPYLADAAEALFTLLTATEQMNAALDKSLPALAAQSKSYGDYSAAAERMIEATGLVVDVQEDQIKVFEATPFGLVEVTNRFDLLTKSQYDNMKSTDESTQAYLAWVQGAQVAGNAANDFVGRLQAIGETEKIAKESIKEFGVTILEGAEASKYAAGYAELAAVKHITYADAVKKLKDEEMKRREELIKLREAEKERLAAQVTEVSIAGRLSQIYSDYGRSIQDAVKNNADLVKEYNDLVYSGKATEEQLQRIRDEIGKNNQAQKDALETMKKQTAELIYQQAAQGLSSEAALVLARGLGLVSETDYNLITQLQALKMQFDANRDGMVDAAEGADKYTEAIIKLYNATIQLKSSMLPQMTNIPTGTGAVAGGGGMPVGYGMVDLGGGIFQYTAPGETAPTAGNGIYVGGPGETIGPGANAAVNVTNINNGVSLNNEEQLIALLTPIVDRIIAGR